MTRELVQQALDFCVGKNTKLTDRESVVSMLLKKDSWTHSTFRYALAKGICQYLGIHYGELEEVYLTGSTLENRAQFTSDIDLIIKTKRNSEAVVNTLRRLDNDIMIYYRSILGQQVKRMHRILDVELIPLQKGEKSEKNMKGRLFYPLLRIWQRSFNSNNN